MSDAAPARGAQDQGTMIESATERAEGKTQRDMGNAVIVILVDHVQYRQGPCVPDGGALLVAVAAGVQ